MEFIWFIIVGALAGWIASVVMHANTGLMLNVILGIVGGVVGGWVFGMLGLSIGAGFWGELIVAAIGASLVVGLYKLIAK